MNVGGHHMTHKDEGHYRKKHSQGRKVNQEIADAVKKRVSEGEISCAAAFKIADDLKLSPEEVGFTIDFLEVKIIKCQLGFYGYGPGRKIVKPAETVTEDLKKAIDEALVENRLLCATSWAIADRFGVAKMEVSSACEALKVKISSCQLGAF